MVRGSSQVTCPSASIKYGKPLARSLNSNQPVGSMDDGFTSTPIVRGSSQVTCPSASMKYGKPLARSLNSNQPVGSMDDASTSKAAPPSVESTGSIVGPLPLAAASPSLAPISSGVDTMSALIAVPTAFAIAAAMPACGVVTMATTEARGEGSSSSMPSAQSGPSSPPSPSPSSAPS